MTTEDFITELFCLVDDKMGTISKHPQARLHPRREGRSAGQIDCKGSSNRRWSVGGKLCLLLNHLGLVVDWDCDTASVYDGSAFQHLVNGVAEGMVVLADVHFIKKGWHPSNLRPCRRGEWNDRMLVKTVLSMLALVCHLKKGLHRFWSCFVSRIAYTMALFNLLVQWRPLEPDECSSTYRSVQPLN